MSLNLANIPLHSAKLYPSSPAILLNELSISYQVLQQQIVATAAALTANGIQRGDKVALLLPNVPHFTVSYFAILYVGATVVPLNVLFVEDEIRYHLDDSDAKAIIVWEAFLDKTIKAVSTSACKTTFLCRASDAVPEHDSVVDLATELKAIASDNAMIAVDPCNTEADDTAVILYTSGTTGRAKGAELSHFNIFDNARYVSERLTRTDGKHLRVFSEGDIALATLPLFHSFGQTVIQNGFLMNGAAISLLPKFSPTDAASLIEKQKINFFAGVPSMYVALLNDTNVKPEQLSTLEYAVSGGAALPGEVLAQFKSRYNVDILEGYGLSETSPVACFNSLMFGCKPGTVGPAIDLCEVKIVDPDGNRLPSGERGEVVIKGTNIMKGYYKNPDATAEVLKNGWFHTGDVGVMDDEGYVSIVDRLKEMIIRGGFNIYPREVEEVLYAHPDIVEAAIIGVPDATHGEEVVAVYALHEGSGLSHEELETYCREHLAAYKVPRKSIVLESLPKGPTGKILKRVIIEEYVG